MADCEGRDAYRCGGAGCEAASQANNGQDRMRGRVAQSDAQTIRGQGIFVKE